MEKNSISVCKWERWEQWRSEPRTTKVAFWVVDNSRKTERCHGNITPKIPMGNLTSSESIICKELTKPIHQLTSAVACLICSEPTKPIQQLTSAVACLICKELTKLSNSWHQQLAEVSFWWKGYFLLLSLLVKLPIGIFMYYHGTFLSFCYCPPPKKQLLSFAVLSVIALIFLIHTHRDTILLHWEA